MRVDYRQMDLSLRGTTAVDTIALMLTPPFYFTPLVKGSRSHRFGPFVAQSPLMTLAPV